MEAHGESGRPRPGPEPVPSVRPVVRRCAIKREPPARGDGARHGDAGRAAIPSPGAAEGVRRAWVRLLHQLREPEGPGTRGQPAGGRGAVLARAAPPGSDHGERAVPFARGIRALFPHSPSRCPDQRAGFTSEPPDRGQGGAGAAIRKGGGPPRGDRRAAPRGLGRPAAVARHLRVLAGTTEPAARPVSLRSAKRGSVADRSAPAMTAEPHLVVSSKVAWRFTTSWRGGRPAWRAPTPPDLGPRPGAPPAVAAHA